MKTLQMVLVTGANGFLGKALCQMLSGKMPVRRVFRSVSAEEASNESSIFYGDLSANFDWSEALSGVSSVVHCAARVHVMRELARNPLDEFRAINVAGTLNLARQAAMAGAKRFVFISSIGVNGGETFDKPFSAEDAASPHTPYAVSKYEAEVALLQLAKDLGMEVVIIRPPLIYGPGAPGNFASLVKLLRSGIPVPLASVTANRRSFVYLGNLLDLIETCLVHPAAANNTFLVSDGEDLSTAVMLRRLGSAMGAPAWLIPFPVALLRLGAQVLGRSSVVQSLCGSLEVDIAKTQNLLDWTPPFDVDEGLSQTFGHPVVSRID